MAELFLASKAGELPCGVVYEDGSLVSIFNQPTSRVADPTSPTAARSPFTALAVDGLGERAAACDQHGNLVLFDLSGQSFRRVRNLLIEANSLLFSSRNEDVVYTAMADATIRAINTATGDVVANLQGHKSDICAIAQSADGGILVTASSDVALLWNTSDWKRMRSLGSPAGIADMSIAPAAGLIAVAFKEDVVFVWDMSTFSVVAKLRLTDPEVGAGLLHLAISEDGSIVAAAADNGCVYVWDVASQALVRIVDVPQTASIVIQLALVSSSVATAQAKSLAESSSTTGGGGGGGGGGEGAAAASGAFGPSPPQLMMLCDDGQLLVVELGPHVCTALLELQAPNGRGAIRSFSSSRDASLLAIATDDGRIVLYDVPQAMIFRIEAIRQASSSSSSQAGGEGEGEEEEAGELTYAPLEGEEEEEEQGEGASAAGSAAQPNAIPRPGSFNYYTGSDDASEEASTLERGPLPEPRRGGVARGPAAAAPAATTATQTTPDESEIGATSGDINVLGAGSREYTQSSAAPPPARMQVNGSGTGVFGAGTSSFPSAASSSLTSSRAASRDKGRAQAGPGPASSFTTSSNAHTVVPPYATYPSVTDGLRTETAGAPAFSSSSAASSSASSSFPIPSSFDFSNAEGRETWANAGRLHGRNGGSSGTSTTPGAAASTAIASSSWLREGSVPGLPEPSYSSRRQAFVDGYGGSDRGAGALLRAKDGGAASIAARAEVTGGVPGSETWYAAGGAVRASVGPSPSLAGPPGAPLHELMARAAAAAGANGAGGFSSFPTAPAIPPQVVDSAAITTHRKLAALLTAYGQLPAKYRSQAWRFLLRLPRNAEAFATLTARGAHTSWSDLESRYPVTDRRLLMRLSRTVNALAHWSPVFGEVPFLPVLAFPFVKFFGADDEVCVEAVMAVLVNWGAHWVETLPHPPLPLLGRLHSLLSYWDKTLASHLEELGADPVRYAWPILRSAFSEVLLRNEWEFLWDHLFMNAHDPSLLLYAVVAYLRTMRGPLLGIRVPATAAPSLLPGARPGHGQGGASGPFRSGSASSATATSNNPFVSRHPGFNGPQAALSSRVITPALAEVCTFLRHQNPINVRAMVKMMHTMRAETPAHAHPYPINAADRSAAESQQNGSGSRSGSGAGPDLRSDGPAGPRHPGAPGLSTAYGSVPGTSQAVPSFISAGGIGCAAPYSGPLNPVPTGYYPPFLRYPTFVVDFQLAERKRIAEEEKALVSRRSAAQAQAKRIAELEAAEIEAKSERVMLESADARRTAEAAWANRVRAAEADMLERDASAQRLAAAVAESRLKAERERLAAAVEIAAQQRQRQQQQEQQQWQARAEADEREAQWRAAEGANSASSAAAAILEEEQEEQARKIEAAENAAANTSQVALAPSASVVAPPPAPTASVPAPAPAPAPQPAVISELETRTQAFLDAPTVSSSAIAYTTARSGSASPIAGEGQEGGRDGEGVEEANGSTAGGALPNSPDVSTTFDSRPADAPGNAGPSRTSMGSPGGRMRSNRASSTTSTPLRPAPSLGDTSNVTATTEAALQASFNFAHSVISAEREFVEQELAQVRAVRERAAAQRAPLPPAAAAGGGAGRIAFGAVVEGGRVAATPSHGSKALPVGTLGDVSGSAEVSFTVEGEVEVEGGEGGEGPSTPSRAGGRRRGGNLGAESPGSPLMRGTL